MRLRVLTYNIKDGGLGREQPILAVLTAARPDVIVLQEVYEQTDLHGWAAALDMAAVRARGNTRRHLALLSRLPIITCESYHPNPPIHTALLAAELQTEAGHTLSLFGAHLMAGPFVAMELWRLWEIATILKRVGASSANPALLVGDFNAIAPGDRVDVQHWPQPLRLILALQAGHVFRATLKGATAAGLRDCFRASHPTDPGFTLPASAPNTRLD